MSKKLNWLDKFAEERAKKETLKKQASSEKTANQIIVNPEDVPSAEQGSTIEFNGEQFKVVDANFSDEMGPGVVLEKAANYENLKGDPMDVSMGAPAGSVSTPSTQGQEYARDEMNATQQTYTNDEDAQYGMSSAPSTEQEIADENTVDRTTVPGRYTKSPGLNTTPTTEVTVTMETPVDTNTIDTQNVTEVVPESTELQVPVENVVEDEKSQEDSPIEEDVKEDTTEDVKEDTEEETKEENKILSKVKKSLPKKVKKAKKTKVAMNTTIINLASDVTDAIVAETEDVLEDAEEAVKQLVPSHLASKALELLENELEEEGVEALFDKAVKMNKTASEEEDLTDEELKDVIKKIAEAVAEEMEDVLADADDTMDEERETLAENEDQFELEAKLKTMVERKLHAKGIYTRFARTAKKVQKKTIAQKIREARKNR